MSAVPELDRLIEEAENTRINKAWDRRDRVFKLFLSSMFFLVLLAPPALLFLGELGCVLIAVAFSALTVPLLAGAAFNILHDLLSPPPKRDLTKRYHYK